MVTWFGLKLCVQDRVLGLTPQVRPLAHGGTMLLDVQLRLWAQSEGRSCVAPPSGQSPSGLL